MNWRTCLAVYRSSHKSKKRFGSFGHFQRYEPFPTDEENRRFDELALESLDYLDTTGLVETCRTHQISICGLMPAAIVLETLRHLARCATSIKTSCLCYECAANGDQSRVVGYAGMLFD